MITQLDPFKTRLTRTRRIVVMVSLFASFFIVSPIIILHTAGYRYSFLEHKIKETGVLSVDIKPKNADVWLNNIHIKKRLPFRLPNRAPGTYHLRISKNGYKSWEKDISINSKQTTYIKDVVLLKDASPTPVAIGKKNIQSIYSDPHSSKLVLVSQTDQLSEVITFNSQEKNITHILREPAIFNLNIDTSPFNSLFFIAYQKQNKNHLILNSFKNPEEAHTLEFASNTMPKTQWSYNSEGLYIQDKDTIKKFSINEPEIIVGKTSSSVWFVDHNNELWTITDNYLKNQSNTKIYYIENHIEKIIDLRNRHLLAKIKNNNLILLEENENKFTKTHEIPCDSYQYNKELDEWDIWTSWEWWKVFGDGSVLIVKRQEQKLFNLIPLDAHGLMLLYDAGGLDTFSPPYNVEQNLLSTKKIIDIAVYQDKREIYFLEENNGTSQLYQLEY